MDLNHPYLIITPIYNVAGNCFLIIIFYISFLFISILIGEKDGVKIRGFVFVYCFFFLPTRGLDNASVHELLNNIPLITCFNDMFLQDLH